MEATLICEDWNDWNRQVDALTQEKENEMQEVIWTGSDALEELRQEAGNSTVLKLAGIAQAYGRLHPGDYLIKNSRFFLDKKFFPQYKGQTGKGYEFDEDVPENVERVLKSLDLVRKFMSADYSAWNSWKQQSWERDVKWKLVLYRVAAERGMSLTRREFTDCLTEEQFFSDLPVEMAKAAERIPGLASFVLAQKTERILRLAMEGKEQDVVSDKVLYDAEAFLTDRKHVIGKSRVTKLADIGQAIDYGIPMQFLEQNSEFELDDELLEKEAKQSSWIERLCSGFSKRRIKEKLGISGEKELFAYCQDTAAEEIKRQLLISAVAKEKQIVLTYKEFLEWVGKFPYSTYTIKSEETRIADLKEDREYLRMIFTEKVRTWLENEADKCRKQKELDKQREYEKNLSGWEWSVDGWNEAAKAGIKYI